jgi:hypothetical protein
MSFFPTTCRFINWRALSLTLFLVLLISLLWEATLALPYGWWNYQHRQMMGLFIGAWDDLPIEAVFVWLAVAYGTIIVFEVVKLWQASGLPARKRSWVHGNSPLITESHAGSLEPPQLLRQGVGQEIEFSHKS